MKRDLHIGQFMTRTPACCDQYESLMDARGRMMARKIRHLPVVEDGVVVGILSAGDIDTLHRCPHVDMTRATVADAMTPAPYVVSIFTPVEEVVQTMADRRYGSAVIVDGNKHVRGIFTTIDALALLATWRRTRGAGRKPTRVRVAPREVAQMVRARPPLAHKLPAIEGAAP